VGGASELAGHRNPAPSFPAGDPVEVGPLAPISYKCSELDLPGRKYEPFADELIARVHSNSHLRGMHTEMEPALSGRGDGSFHPNEHTLSVTLVTY